MKKDYKKRDNWALIFRRWLQNTHKTSTADMKNKTSIDYYPDDEAFTDHKAIHIGTHGVMDILGVETKEDFADASRFLMMHEELHCRHTVHDVYVTGILIACEKVAAYIYEKTEGTVPRWRRNSFAEGFDWKNYLEGKFQTTSGKCFNVRGMHKMISHLFNAIEDGRIEVLGVSDYPGFGELRTRFRGENWQQDPTVEPFSVVDGKPGRTLSLILNQVHSLATCQIYQKGFFLNYNGTPIMPVVQSMMQNVGAAILSPTTEGMVYQIIGRKATRKFSAIDGLIEKFAPYIMDAFTYDPSDINAQEELAAMLREIFIKIAENLPETPEETENTMNTGLSASEEDTDTEIDPSSTFKNSDITVTLPDETYDKLMANRKSEKKDENAGGGINLRREHPIENEEEDSEENSSNSSRSGDSSSQPENNQNNSEDDYNLFNEDSTTNSSANGESQDDPFNEQQGSSSSEKSSGEQTSSDSNNSNDSDENNADSNDKDESSNTSDVGTDSDETKSDSETEADKIRNENSVKADSAEDSKSTSNKNSDNEGNETGNSGSSSQDKGMDSDEKSEDSATNTEMNSFDSENGMSNMNESKEGPSESDGSGDGRDGTCNNGESTDVDESAETIRDVERQIEEEIRNAKQNSDGKEIVKSVNEQKSFNSKQKVRKEVKDTSKPLDPEKYKHICNFAEVHRNYDVSLPLPFDIESRGRVLHRKNATYFKGMKTPTITYLDSGSVDPSRIYGAGIGDTDIFRKRGKDKSFDGCAYILIDNSGSMKGAKRESACRAAAIIEEGFKGLIPFKIVAFDYNGTVCHEVIKNWTEVLNKNCCWNFCKKSRDGWGNADAYDIQIATDELMRRPEQKKLLIVLSDGTPAEASEGQTKKAIMDARRKGIQVSGIYFEEGEIGCDADAFKAMYMKDYVCCTDKQIDKNLTNILMKWSRS